jgi:hypothetical protein
MVVLDSQLWSGRLLLYSEVAFVAWGGGGGPSASYIVFPSLCVPSVSAGNLATSPVPGTVSLDGISGSRAGHGLQI